jgi:hypothetical protein
MASAGSLRGTCRVRGVDIDSGAIQNRVVMLKAANENETASLPWL